MRTPEQTSLTQGATRALTDAVSKVIEEHRRRGIPLAIWRDGRAVSVPASEVLSLREPAFDYGCVPDGFQKPMHGAPTGA